MQATETGADDHYLGALLAFQSRSIEQAIRAGVGVIAGNVVGRLLKHAGLVKFYAYNFMKNYTVNFTTATVRGAKKIPSKATWAGFLSIRQRY
jgi:ribosomal protein S5